MSGICSFAGCGEPRCGRGLCNSHWAQWNNGRKLHAIGDRFKPRIIVPHPEISRASVVILTRGKIAIIDTELAGEVGKLNWSWNKGQRGSTGYASTNIGKTPDRYWQSLHRFVWEVLDRPSTPQVDHEDMDGLNCRGGNLRAATSSQNRCNTRARSDNASGVKGVCWVKRTGKWHAQAGINGRIYHVGYFTQINDAAVAVAAARERLHGEFARHV